MIAPETSSGGFLPGPRADLSATGSGVLNGLRFAVKDLIDVDGYKTGCGNPQWQAAEDEAPRSTRAVVALLAVGAHCVGKTITDEFAFSLEGRNRYYGTPRNPRNAQTLPGGLSSGAAIAVASGAVDFALGTDTGGSVRLPAAWCGIFGFKPGHDAISTDGVLPFAPNLDTIGWFARDASGLKKVGQVLLPQQPPRRLSRICLVDDGLDLLGTADAASFKAPAAAITSAPALKLFETWPISRLHQTYSTIQAYEIAQGILPRLDIRKIALAPDIAARFEGARQTTVEDYRRRPRYRHRFAVWMSERCTPDTTLALSAVSVGALDLAAEGSALALFYRHTLGLNAVAGLWVAPQIQFARRPRQGLALSLLAAPGADHALLDLVKSSRGIRQ